MFELILPKSIIQAEKSFIFDDDFSDFENDSILKYYRKDDQDKIKSITNIPIKCNARPVRWGEASCVIPGF